MTNGKAKSHRINALTGILQFVAPARCRPGSISSRERLDPGLPYLQCVGGVWSSTINVLVRWLPAGTTALKRPPVSLGFRKSFAICLLQFAFCLSVSRSVAEPLAENQARFGSVTGDVGVLTQGAKDWIAPHEGLPIEPGDHIRTAEDSQVELVMAQNVLWVLEPESEMIMEHMEENAGRFDIASGALLGKVDSKRTLGSQLWEFATPTAVCAVRGTEFAIESTRTDGSHLAVFEGEVEMRSAEAATGEGTPVRIGALEEGVMKRGIPFKKLSSYSPRMARRAAQRALLSASLAKVERTWSPHTPHVREELRAKFVPPLKHSPVKPKANFRLKLRHKRGGTN